MRSFASNQLARRTSLALAFVLCGAAVQAQTAPYRLKDNIEGAVVKFATFPVRPMLLDPTGRLWVVDHHNSKLSRFTPPFDAATTYDVPADPVSVAYWEGTSSEPDDDEVLVVCRASWAIARVDANSGEMKSVIQLRESDGPIAGRPVRMGSMAEPADILVDDAPPSGDNDRAFVSCSGGNSVLQIDLVTGQVVRVFREDVALGLDTAFQIKSPLFLSFEPAAPGVARKVLVAPLHSGNNSAWLGGTTTGASVTDLVAAGSPLPDADLFRITPVGAATPNGLVEVVGRVTGTLLFAHGVNPLPNSDGHQELWQLNTDAQNKTTGLQGEPAIAGKFSFNRITRLRLPLVANGAGIPNANATHVPLDPPAMIGSSGGSITTQTTVGQPYSIAFNSSYGQAFVTGLLTDNVMMFDKNGNTLTEWDVVTGGTDRAIPRAVIVKATTGLRTGDVLVYCWGDNKVREYHYALNQTPQVTATNTYTLRADPATVAVRAGRSHFFDGTNSAFANTSCATCHVEGGTDFLAWNLSNLPLTISGTPPTRTIDDKGGMVTQTLVGLQRLMPFHWRGERTLDDFNEFAFHGLLGGTQLGEQEFDEFEEFLFSLHNPANPNQHRERIVDGTQDYASSVPHKYPNAVDGQDAFFDEDVFKGHFRCIDCHAAPTGTINDVNTEVLIGRRPRLSHLKPSPFHELWRKQSTTAKIAVTLDADGNRAFLGSGFGHVGAFDDLFDFHFIVNTEDGGQNRSDIVAFVDQWDQGVAPAVHFAFTLDAASVASGAAAMELTSYLEPEAGTTLRNCDIVVIGTTRVGSALVHTRWWYDRNLSGGTYVSDRPTTTGTRTLATFLTNASIGSPTAPLERNIFLGVPVGSGERFAVDADLDGLRDHEDAAPTTPFVDTGDSTLPTFTIQPNVPWITASVARVQFETDEPTTCVLHYRRKNTTDEHTLSSKMHSKAHTFVVPDLQPSTFGGDPPNADPVVPTRVIEYEFWVDAVDRNNNTATSGIVTERTQYFITNNQGLPFPPPLGQVWTPVTSVKDRQLLHEQVISSSSLDVTYDATTVTAAVSFGITYKRGGDWINNEFSPKRAGKRVVIGHVLVREAATGKVVALTPTGLSACHVADTVALASGNGTTGFDEVLVVDGAGAGPGAKYVISDNPTFAGGTSFSFSFPRAGWGAGDEVIFVVDAVVEVPDTSVWATDLTTLDACTTGLCQLVIHTAFGAPITDDGWGFQDGQGAFNQWSFPDSGETLSAPSDKL